MESKNKLINQLRKRVLKAESYLQNRHILLSEQTARQVEERLINMEKNLKKLSQLSGSELRIIKQPKFLGVNKQNLF